eukprot:SAG31_NODE_15687_length_743_cov_0.888199_1_plen_24_part_10
MIKSILNAVSNLLFGLLAGHAGHD